jgi:hypothetical protein
MNMADAAEALTSGGVGAVLGSTLGGLAGKATKFAARATGLGGAKFVQQTILSWEGSERPQFTVGMKFVAIRPTDDPRIPAMNLMRRCMPSTGASAPSVVAAAGDMASGIISTVSSALGLGAIDLNKNLLTAPNGYKSLLGTVEQGVFSRNVEQSGVEGTCTVTIGKWFRALNQILLSADFDISRATLPSGVPLYAEGKITFEPYRMITDEEFDSYFPVIANTSDTVYTT